MEHGWHGRLGPNALPAVAMAPKAGQGPALTLHMLACLAMALHQKLGAVKVTKYIVSHLEFFCLLFSQPCSWGRMDSLVSMGTLFNHLWPRNQGSNQKSHCWFTLLWKWHWYRRLSRYWHFCEKRTLQNSYIVILGCSFQVPMFLWWIQNYEYMLWRLM